jgi:hypothetical protein
LLTREVWRNEVQFRGPADSKERTLSWLDDANLIDLAADGSMIAFEDWGEAAGASGLGYIRKTDGSPALKLGRWAAPVLSADHKHVLALEATTVGITHIAVLPVGSGETQSLNVSGMSQVMPNGWTADGKHVYFAGDDGHGWRIFLYDLVNGQSRALTPPIFIKSSHLEVSTLSPDEKYLFARDLSGNGQLYPLSGGDPVPVRGWDPRDIWVNWSADGKSIYVHHDDKITAPLFRIDLATGRRQLINTITVTDPSGVTAISGVRITRDGKSYAYSYARELSDLYLAENLH